MTLMDHQQKGFKAVLVGLADRSVHIYRDKFLADVIHTPGVVAALLYGKFGREDGSLVMTMRGEFQIAVVQVAILDWISMDVLETLETFTVPLN